ncbi:Transposon TX1 uncharacterized protein [Nymphaea thermarum]|nr:Transposon TX1 uncharacterized protein [Nymphaea thermarum]
MKVDHTTRIPIWIQIPNLATELWNQSVFEGIARTLGGEVVSIDPFTRSLVRMGYARMCIEVPLCFSPQPEIFLRRTNGDFIRVEIVYESMIRFYRKCGSLSHLDSNCAQSREVSEQTLEANRFSALQTNMEETDSHVSSQLDPHEHGATSLEKPNLMAAWIAGEEQSRGASSNKRRRPLGLSQLALDTTNCSTPPNAQHSPKINTHQHRSGLSGENVGSPKGGGSGNALSSPSLKKLMKKSHSQGKDLHSQMALAFQAPPSWPIYPGDNKALLIDNSSFPSSLPVKGKQEKCNIRPTPSSQDLIMEVDPGELSANSKSAPSLLKEGTESLLADPHLPSDGRARVIAGWNPTTIRVVDIILCRDWIGLIANERHGSQTFATFGVYFHPHRSNHQAALQTLSTSLRNLVLPIAVIGDFNVVRDSNDKSGRAPNSSSCNDFNQFIVDNNLSIVEDPQRHFTWSNNRRNSATILCKLDWAMVNADWVLHVGDQNSLQILPRCTSDHSALVLCSVKASYRNPLRGQFKFLKNWSLRGECEEVISEGWNYQASGCAFIRVLAKLEVTRSKLSAWNRLHYGNISQKIDSIQKELDVVQARMDSGDSSLSDLEYCIRLELQATLREEELLWAQKSRTNWLKNGDRNTKFYQQVASGRKSRQSLSAISVGDLTIEAQDQNNEECTKFFKALLCEDAATGSMFEHLSPSLIVSREENLQLLAPISDSEIKHAVFSSKADSAPGPDGFPAFFYQRYWHIVGEDITKAIKGFFQTGRLVKKINRSILVLIPKHQGTCSPQDLRPIALCNSLYKFITKVICIRMRPILTRIIADSQGAFTKGRKLQDQVAMAHEVVNSMFVHYAPSVCCQLDLSKAYDRVNWNFLRNSLLSMGFHDAWIARIMTCVSTASIAISVNGVVGQYFHNSRGLRQGDPMSPLLFIGIMECLHRRILHSVNSNKLCGPIIPRVGKAPVDLFFADDIIFFLPLKVKFLLEIKGIMGEFEMKAGMKVNDAKSRMVTFNAKEDLNNLAVASTDWPLASLPLNYLGLPLFVGKFRPKGERGVGLKSIKDLNRACLGNLALLVGHTTSSWASLASQKYLSNHSLWTRKGKAKDSWLWRGIEWGWDTIKKEVKWSVGNGATARVWLDEWGEGILLFKVPSFEFYTLVNMRALSVAELKFAIQHNFDAKCLAKDVCPHLSSIHLSQSPDLWQWKGLDWNDVAWQHIWEDIRKKENVVYWKKTIWDAAIPPRAQWMQIEEQSVQVLSSNVQWVKAMWQMIRGQTRPPPGFHNINRMKTHLKFCCRNPSKELALISMIAFLLLRNSAGPCGRHRSFAGSVQAGEDCPRGRDDQSAAGVPASVSQGVPGLVAAAFEWHLLVDVPHLLGSDGRRR